VATANDSLLPRFPLRWYFFTTTLRGTGYSICCPKIIEMKNCGYCTLFPHFPPSKKTLNFVLSVPSLSTKSLENCGLYRQEQSIFHILSNYWVSTISNWKITYMIKKWWILKVTASFWCPDCSEFVMRIRSKLIFFGIWIRIYWRFYLMYDKRQFGIRTIANLVTSSGSWT